MADKGEKMPVFVGEDGRLYFNFAVGLKMAMHGSDRDKSENYEYEIYDCKYIGNTEYYGIKIDGIPMPVPDSANRVKYLISRYGVRPLAVGERRELPLTVGEAKHFYETMEYRRTEAQRKAKSIAEYVALKSEANALSSEIGYAEALEKDERAEYLTAKQARLECQAKEVLKAQGIDPDDVEEPKRCAWCGGRGYIAKTVCGCALKREKEIKAFCATERLRLKAFTNGGVKGVT